MSDSRDRRKVKDIAEGRRDAEGKVIKDYPDALDTKVKWKGVNWEKVRRQRVR